MLFMLAKYILIALSVDIYKGFFKNKKCDKIYLRGNVHEGLFSQ